MKMWRKEEGHVVPTALNRALSIVFAVICWGGLAAAAILSEAGDGLKMAAVAFMVIACVVSIHDTLTDCR